MANTKQSKKRVRQSIKKNIYNSSKKSVLKTSIKKFINIIKLKDKNKSTLSFKETISIIDKTANKKIIHRNKASRYKSKLLNLFKLSLNKI